MSKDFVDKHLKPTFGGTGRTVHDGSLDYGVRVCTEAGDWLIDPVLTRGDEFVIFTVELDAKGYPDAMGKLHCRYHRLARGNTPDEPEIKKAFDAAAAKGTVRLIITTPNPPQSEDVAAAAAMPIPQHFWYPGIAEDIDPFK